MSQPASVSVIIVTYNSSATIAESLRAVRPSEQSQVLETIVVDNNSSDGTLVQITGEFPEIKTIANRRNLGFACGCNVGADAAQGEYLLFLNPDLMPDKGAVEQLLMAMKTRPKVGAATGRLRYASGDFQANCRHFPTISNLLFSRGSAIGRLLLNRLFPNSGYYTLPDYADVTEVPAVAGTMMLVRRDLFKLAGGFDRRYFIYMEDTDLCLRLDMSGYKNLFVPQAGAVHGFGKGSSAGKFIRAWHHHQSLWRYFLKHYPNGFSLILLPVLLSVHLVFVCLLPERKV